MKPKDKIVHELTVEELVKLATGVEVKMESLSEASTFIYELGIKHGREKITSQLVFWTYQNWRGWNNKKQRKAEFFKDFKKYFECHRDKHGYYYLLDPKPFDTSEEAYWQMRAKIRHDRSKKTN